MLNKFINEELIFTNYEVDNYENLFLKLSDYFYNRKLVKKDFGKGLLEREREYPTGLELVNYNVAIPHGNPEFIKSDFISIIVLKEPIKFHRMDMPNNEIQTKLLFILGLSDGDSHLIVLQEIMKLLQSETTVNKIISATNNKDILNILKEEILKNDN